MSAAVAVIDRVKTNLVGLEDAARARNPRRHAARHRARRNNALEAIDVLLTEELTLRENRRVKMALQMARLSAIKTLAGFDFCLPALARQEPHHGARRDCSSSIAPKPSISSDRPAPARPTQPRARRRGGQSRPQRLLRLARRHRRRARQSRTRGRFARKNPLLLPLRAADRRRDRLSAGHRPAAAISSSSSSTPATKKAP